VCKCVFMCVSECICVCVCVPQSYEVCQDAAKSHTCIHVSHSQLSHASCLLSAVCCILSAVYCLLSAVKFLLYAVCCLRKRKHSVYSHSHVKTHTHLITALYSTKPDSNLVYLCVACVLMKYLVAFRSITISFKFVSAQA
jgi:hypothetical protein